MYPQWLPGIYEDIVECEGADQPSNATLPVTEQPMQEEKNRHHDMDESTRKKLEIGAGLLAGAAAIGTLIGAGVFAYKRHKERSGRYQPRVAWVSNEGQDMPRDAIQGGEERGERLFICRAPHEGGLMLGKACRVFKKGGVICFCRKEFHVEKYEILVGDSRAVKWVNVHGKINVNTLGARPVEGGKEPHGDPQYIAQAAYHGAVYPGKACVTFDGCFIPYDGTEKAVMDYSVLCYA